MSHDDLDGLSSYFAEFSALGSIPTSLGGYGFGAGRHFAELEALSATRATERFPAREAANVIASRVGAGLFQNYLNALQVWVTKTGFADAETYAAWRRYVDVFQEPHSAVAVPTDKAGLKDFKIVLISAQALKRLSTKAAASGNLQAEAARPIGSKPGGAPAKQPSVKPVTRPVVSTPVGGDYKISTADVQSILVGLGWKSLGKTSGPLAKAMTDGTFGPTTAGNWKQSAQKRKLDPSIAKSTPDGKEVVVREATYAALRALVTAPPPMPVAGSSLWSLPPSVVTSVTVERLGDVLGRLVGAQRNVPAALQTIYVKVATERNLDSRNEASSDKKNVAVITGTWNALVKEYDSKAPMPPSPAPSEKQNVDAAMAEIAKRATAVTPSNTLKTAFNSAIQAGTVKRELFTTNKWTADYVPLLLKVIGPTDAILIKAWEQMLLPGKLVSRDLSSVKLLSETSKALTDLAASYKAAAKTEAETFKGYTKVNTAEIIGAINDTNVSEKLFDRSGGHKELADAARTFLENTKQSSPGDLVRVQKATKEVFLKTDVLTKIAAAVKTAKERAKAVAELSKTIVENARKESSAKIAVEQLQQAFAETVAEGKAGPNKKLYAAVKLSGVWDGPTRAAYTELARTLTLGPALADLEKRLRAQLGPKYKASLLLEMRNSFWNALLEKTTAEAKNVFTLPAVAKSVIAASDAYRARMGSSVIAKQRLEARRKTMDDAVKKSNVIIPIVDAQMGLLQKAALKEIKKPAGLVITGLADNPTKEGLFEFSGQIFPLGKKESWDWDKYLFEVGIRVGTDGSVKKGWTGSNYVALPQSVADELATRAGEWVAKNGVPAASKSLAPLPLSNQELRLRFDKPTVIRAKAPSVAAVTEIPFDERGEKEAAKRARRLAELRRKRAQAAQEVANKKRQEAEAAKETAAKNLSDQQAQQTAQKAETDAKMAENLAARQAAEAAKATTEAQQATTAAGGQVGPITIAPQISITEGGRTAPVAPPTLEPAPAPVLGPVEPAPAPTPSPAPEPAPGPVQEAGMGAGMGWLLLSALGLGFLIFGAKDKGQDAGAKTRYSPRRV